MWQQTAPEERNVCSRGDPKYFVAPEERNVTS